MGFFFTVERHELPTSTLTLKQITRDLWLIAPRKVAQSEYTTYIVKISKPCGLNATFSQVDLDNLSLNPRADND